MKLLRQIIIPDYPDKVLVSKARRPIYYGLGMKHRNKIPASFLGGNNYFDELSRLINGKTGEPRLANPKVAGKPRYWVVNFQDIWNGNMAKQARANIIGKLKDIIVPHIVPILPLKSFPIELSIVIYDIVCPVDISNRGAVYTKVIEDLLVSEGKIPDDKIDYINCSGSCRFEFVKDVKDKRMVISLIKSTR